MRIRQTHTFAASAERESACWVTGLALVCLLLPAGSFAATRYADTTLGSNCLTTYNASTRTCGSGAAIAYNTVAGAVGAALAGDLVLVRAATISGGLTVSVSGTALAPITIMAAPGETVTFSGGTRGLTSLGRADVAVEGFTFSGHSGFCEIYDSTRITVHANTFLNSTGSGTTAGCKVVRTTLSRITNNTLTNGNDSLLLQDASNSNLVEGNTFITGRHSLVSIRCSNNNLFRDNVFTNSIQKAVEIYDCTGVSDAPVLLNATRRNFFDQNTWTQTAPPLVDQDNDHNAIQHSGQQNVIRRSVFYGAMGGGLAYQQYSTEALYVHGNRAYNNVFHQNDCHALIGDTGPDDQYFDNRVFNNIFFANTGTGALSDCRGGTVQTRVPNPSKVILTNNALVTVDPGFVSAAARDYRLLATSAQIDVGSWLTQANGAGTASTTLVVDDALPFSDGLGIPGEVGDTIQFQGSTATATIVAVNVATNTLTLSTALTWSDNQPLSLAYQGVAPDRGAFEFSTYTPPPGIPAPPFGIAETLPAEPIEWASNAIHASWAFVDNSGVSGPCTDTSNPNGRPGLPRCTLPPGPFDGTGIRYIIVGNDHILSGSSLNRTWTCGSLTTLCWLSARTLRLETNPWTGQPVAAVEGPTRPRIRIAEFIFKGRGAYLIQQGFHFDGPGGGGSRKIRAGAHSAAAPTHMAFRYNLMVGDGVADNGAVIACSGVTGTGRTQDTTDIIVYGNRIYNYGSFTGPSQNDIHGVKCGEAFQRIWVLNNIIHHLGGDSSQMGSASMDDAERGRFVYIGDNTTHDNFENGYDFKEVDDVILSRNNIGPSNDSGIVTHNSTLRTWIIFNTIWGGTDAPGASSSDMSGNAIYYVGNLFYSILCTPADLNCNAINIGGGSPTTIVNNTIVSVDNGVEAEAGTNPIEASGNLFVSASLSHINLSSGSVGASNIDYSLFWQLGASCSSGTSCIVWGDGVTRTLASLQSTFSECTNCLNVNPQFLNAAALNFRLSATSPARDFGVRHSIYTTFETTYGRSIDDVDLVGTARPSGSTGWDIGAFEFAEPVVANIVPLMYHHRRLRF
jgi:hypothetical protein